MAYSTASGAVIRIGVEGSNESQRQIAAVSASMNQLTNTVSSAMKTLASTVGITGGLAGIIQMSDAYAKYNAQLRLATQTQAEFRAAQEAVTRIANSAQQDLAATGTLYARIAKSTQELGISQSRVADITESVNLALKVSGATSEEAASAQLQLSQAFASGTLRGEEFNAVNEAAPRLMQALADGIGVPVGALKDMASNGEITSKVMASVLPQALEQLRAEAAQVQTISGAFTVLKNNVTAFTAEHAQANGTVAVLTTGLGLLANNLTLAMGLVQTLTAAKVATWLGNWVVETVRKTSADRAAAASALAAASADLAAARAAETLAVARVAEVRAAVLAAEGNTALAITANGLIPAQARAAQAAVAHTAALTAQATAARAASTAGALASSALGLLGGPIGAIVTLLGIGATAWSLWSQRSRESAQESAEHVEQSTEDIIASLDKQIEKLKRRNELAAATGAKITDSPETEKLASLRAEISKVSNQEGVYSNLDPAAKLSLLMAYGGQISALTEKVRQLGEETDKATELKNKKNLSQWMTDYATKAEKLEAELKKARTELGNQFTPELESRIRKAFETRDAGAAKELTAYQRLSAAIRTKTEENEQEAKAGIDASESQKTLIKLDQDLATGKLKLSAANQAQIRTLLTEQAASEQSLKTQKAAREVQAWIEQSTDARTASTAALKVEYEMYGKNSDARDVAMVKVRNETELEKFLTAARREHKLISDQMISDLRQEVDERTKVEQATLAQSKALAYASQLGTENKKFSAESLADPRARAQALLDIDADVWKKRIALAGDGTAAQKELQSQYDTWYANQQKRILVDVDLTRATEMIKVMEVIDQAAQQAAASMESSFGRVGAAIGGMTTALTGYEHTQAAIAAQLVSAVKDSGGDQTKIQEANARAAASYAQAQVKAYGDMAGAAKGFFKENSTGYKVLEATEKAYRAVEMALAIEAMAKKIFFKETEVTANTALNATKLAGEATASAASTGLAATEASAWGITAVVKAIASLPFPLNLAAGAATLAAVIAIGAKMMGGGSSSVSLSQQRQESQGTGSVLGDSSAKSESLSRAIELAANNSSIELTHTAGMLASLKAIESSISGLGSLLVRGTDVTSLASSVSSTSSGGFFGGIISSIFGGKTTVDDTGIQINKSTVADISAGALNSQSYIDTTKSGGWFSSDKHNTQTADLGAEVDAQFTKVIEGLADSVTTAAGLLGVGGDEFTKHLNEFVVDIGKISLKDLSGDEIQDALEAVFSKVGDDMAQFALSGLSQFQQVGEGYLETLTRVATDYANLDSMLESIGGSFGAVGIDSIAAREHLIDLAGGIDELASQTSSFAQNFLTQAEQLAPVQKYVTEQLAAMGLQSLDTRDKFKEYVLDLVNSGKLATEAGAAQYTQLMALQDLFAQTHAATKDLTKTEQEIADERADLQNQYDELVMTAAELQAKERASIDVSNQALYDQIVAQKALAAATEAATEAATAATEAANAAAVAAETKLATAQSNLLSAYQKEASALQTLISQRNAEAEATKNLIDSLALGDMSDLSPYEKYLEAQRQFDAAAPGEEKNSAAQALLQASRNYNGSTEAYARDYAKVQSALVTQLASQRSAATTAQKQLDALEDQVGSLIDIEDSVDTLNDTMLSVKQAIVDLGKAMLDSAAANSAAGKSGSEDLADKGQKTLEGVLTGIYQDLLGRAPDAEGFAWWLNAMMNGTTVAQVTDGFLNSDEYKAKHPEAHAKGGVADGWSLVGEEGAELVNFSQPGRVYTASQTRAALGGSDNSAAIERQTRAVERQNALVSEQNELLDQQNKLLAAIASDGASSEDIRTLKQYMGVVLSRKAMTA
jgi:tape measure domain-containing protein